MDTKEFASKSEQKRVEPFLRERIAALLADNERLRAVAQAVVAWYENAGNADPNQDSPGSVNLWEQARAALKG